MYDQFISWEISLFLCNFSRKVTTVHNKTLMTKHASLNVNDRFIRLSSVWLNTLHLFQLSNVRHSWYIFHTWWKPSLINMMVAEATTPNMYISIDNLQSDSISWLYFEIFCTHGDRLPWWHELTYVLLRTYINLKYDRHVHYYMYIVLCHVTRSCHH